MLLLFVVVVVAVAVAVAVVVVVVVVAAVVAVAVAVVVVLLLQTERTALLRRAPMLFRRSNNSTDYVPSFFLLLLLSLWLS